MGGEVEQDVRGEDARGERQERQDETSFLSTLARRLARRRAQSGASVEAIDALTEGIRAAGDRSSNADASGAGCAAPPVADAPNPLDSFCGGPSPSGSRRIPISHDFNSGRDVEAVAVRARRSE